MLLPEHSASKTFLPVRSTTSSLFIFSMLTFTKLLEGLGNIFKMSLSAKTFSGSSMSTLPSSTSPPSFARLFFSLPDISASFAMLPRSVSEKPSEKVSGKASGRASEKASENLTLPCFGIILNMYNHFSEPAKINCKGTKRQ